MSTAQLVPETWELSGDDAAEVLRERRLGPVLVDSIRRFRVADGFSHARSLAFVTLLTVIPGVIALVGLATVAGAGSFRDGVIDLLVGLSPGPSGEVVTAAINQGASTPARHGYVPLAFGAAAMLIAGTTAFGQIERGANRIYGVEQDRPFRHKYGHAMGMFLISLVIVSAVLFVDGAVHTADLPGASRLWTTAKLLIGAAGAAVMIGVVFQRSPRRHQPNLSWLVVGSSIATLLCVLATLVLAGLWRLGQTFGETYGPLAGVMALALWAYLIAIGLFIGLAFAAQLEAVRAGRSAPQDQEKVAESSPDATNDDAGIGAGSPAHPDESPAPV
jgi:YihY family inner membrane protein